MLPPRRVILYSYVAYKPNQESPYDHDHSSYDQIAMLVILGKFQQSCVRLPPSFHAWEWAWMLSGGVPVSPTGSLEFFNKIVLYILNHRLLIGLPLVKFIQSDG